jgi:hypothetical protein
MTTLMIMIMIMMMRMIMMIMVMRMIRMMMIMMLMMMTIMVVSAFDQMRLQALIVLMTSGSVLHSFQMHFITRSLNLPEAPPTDPRHTTLLSMVMSH